MASTRTYKLEDETYARLKSMQEAMQETNPNVTWDSCFAALANAYESQQAAVDAGRPEEERDFRMLLDRVAESYTAALAAIANTRERIQEAEGQKRAALEETVARQRDSVKEAKESQAKAEDLAKEKATEADQLREALELAEAKTKEALEAKEKAEAERSELSALFKRQINEAESKVEAMSAEVAEAKAVKSERDELSGEVAKLKTDAEASANEIGTLKETIARLEEEAKATAQRHQSEIDKLTGRYEKEAELAQKFAKVELETAVLSAKEEAQKELDALRKEFADFVAEITSKTASAQVTATTRRKRKDGSAAKMEKEE